MLAEGEMEQFSSTAVGKQRHLDLQNGFVLPGKRALLLSTLPKELAACRRDGGRQQSNTCVPPPCQAGLFCPGLLRHVQLGWRAPCRAMPLPNGCWLFLASAWGSCPLHSPHCLLKESASKSTVGKNNTGQPPSWPAPGTAGSCNSGQAMPLQAADRETAVITCWWHGNTPVPHNTAVLTNTYQL